MMADKLHEYEGVGGRLHGLRDKARERWDQWSEWRQQIPTDRGLEGVLSHLRGPPKLERSLDDYLHIYRWAPGKTCEPCTVEPSHCCFVLFCFVCLVFLHRARASPWPSPSASRASCSRARCLMFDQRLQLISADSAPRAPWHKERH